jgi:hypothetical protein
MLTARHLTPFFAALALSCALTPALFAQDGEEPVSDEPVFDLSAPTTVAPNAAGGPVPLGATRQSLPAIALPYRPTYRSAALRGEFLAQRMFIIQGGRRIEFWGARIVRMTADSPLRQLGARAGDVVTRLDGTPIWANMFRRSDGAWQIVELERHFGNTEVRWIAQGTHRVRVGTMNIDTDFEAADEDVPLSP